MPRIDSQDTRIAGYIARTDDRPVAAGRSANEARERAGIADVDIDLATMTELDDLNGTLSPQALGIEPGAAPWWREHAPEPAPGLWCCPDGNFYRMAIAQDLWGGTDPTRVDAYRPPVLERPRLGQHPYLGLGYIVGYLRRERMYRTLDRTVVAHFEISGEFREAVACDDVAVPIVDRVDSGHPVPYAPYLPEYPRCPDCECELAWADVLRPGEVADGMRGPLARGREATCVRLHLHRYPLPRGADGADFLT